VRPICASQFDAVGQVLSDLEEAHLTDGGWRRVTPVWLEGDYILLCVTVSSLLLHGCCGGELPKSTRQDYSWYTPGTPFYLTPDVTCMYAVYSVRRRGQNIDSSSKSNPLRRHGKNYDASTWRRRRRRRKNEESRHTFNKNSCDLLTALYKTNKQFDKKKLWKQNGRFSMM